VLFIAVIVGAVISVLVSVPSLIKARWTASGLRKQIASLEVERDSLRREAAAPQPSTAMEDRSSAEGFVSGRTVSAAGPARER